MKNPFSRKNKITKDDISSLQFKIGGFFYGFDVLEFTINDKAITVTLKHGGRELTGSDYRLPMEKNISVEEWKELLYLLINKVCINKWKESYIDNTILDGTYIIIQ